MVLRTANDVSIFGLSSYYVMRETRRAVAGVAPHVKIWPGIDIDIPTGANDKKTQPDDLYQAVKAAFQGARMGVAIAEVFRDETRKSARRWPGDP